MLAGLQYIAQMDRKPFPKYVNSPQKVSLAL